VLGICYGMQALTHALGGLVEASTEREYGPAQIKATVENPLILPGEQLVWMSHGDRIERLPPGFSVLARSANSPVAAMGDQFRGYYGVQFHPEVRHTPGGTELLRRFVIGVCGANPEWTPASIIQEATRRVQEQVGRERVISAVSGGVDSSVATAIIHQAVGDQLVSVFVDNGLLRKEEALRVIQAYEGILGPELVVIDAQDRFLEALRDRRT
jgi:GMP synthase (glutamine-hydrolysing)